MRRLQSGRGTGLLRTRLQNPDWTLFRQSDLDRMLREPAPAANRSATPRGRGPATPRPAEVGDLLGAIWRLPAVQQASQRVHDEATRNLRRAWRRASTGQRAAVITHSLVLGGSALAGVLSNRSARTTVLNFLDGKSVPVPGVEGLQLQLRHRSGGRDVGGVLTFDLMPYLSD